MSEMWEQPSRAASQGRREPWEYILGMHDFPQMPIYTRHRYFIREPRKSMKDLDVHQKIAEQIDKDNVQLSKFKAILDEISAQNTKVIDTLYRLNERKYM